MKKILALLLMSLILFTSCKESGDEKNDSAKEPKKEESFANFDSSIESYNVGKYDEAIEKLSEIIENKKIIASAYMHRGEAYLAKSDTDENNLILAKDDFTKALELDPTLFHAKEGLAYTLFLQHKIDEAKHLIIEALNSNLKNEYDVILFRISDKYCHECGSFLHYEHPNKDIIDQELISIQNEIRMLSQMVKLQEIVDYSNQEFLFPLPYDANFIITRDYGWGNTENIETPEYYRGIDLAALGGTDIIAVNSGIVEISRVSPTLGNYIVINHGGSVYSLYAHSSSRLAGVGDKITKGDVIAKVGSTGASTGNHLHFAILKNGEYVDPMDYISEP